MNDRTEVPFARPYIGMEEEAAVLRVLRSGWLTTGREALAFETEFAAFLQRGHDTPLQALAVNSATSGLHLALEACHVGPGDIVITTPYTFAATAEIVRYLGAEVVFADIAPDSYLIDPERIERTLERLVAGLPAYPPRHGVSGKGFGPIGRPKVLLPVHIGGLVCPMSTLRALATAYDCKIVEDAAHAFPSFVDEPKLRGYAGTLGDIGVFSFYATKTITTGEGGMVVISNPSLAARMSIMRSHGIDRAVWDRYTDRLASWRYAVVAAGYKYNLPDLLAAVGREQLKRADELLRRRREIADRYDAAFGGDDRFLIPPTGPSDARHLYVLRLANEASDKTGEGSGRDRFIEALQTAGIGVSVHFIPLHTMPYYRDRYGFIDDDFPEAMQRFRASFSLPIWPGMADDQIKFVIAAVRRTADERTDRQ